MKKWLQSDVGLFLLKVLGIYIIWYLVYDLWLLPNGQFDRWLIFNIIGICAGWLQFFGYHVFWVGRLIGLNGLPGVLMVNGCSGISAMGLFVGFVIAYPGRWIPRLCFILIGMGIIYLMNIARIITLVLTQKYWPEAFSFTHTYSTTAIFYIVIFIMWVVWVNWGDNKTAGFSAIQSPAAV